MSKEPSTRSLSKGYRRLLLVITSVAIGSTVSPLRLEGARGCPQAGFLVEEAHLPLDHYELVILVLGDGASHGGRQHGDDFCVLGEPVHVAVQVPLRASEPDTV